VENLRAKGKVSRISIERLCAGPAIPLIYDFYAKKDTKLERTLEAMSGKSFNQITSQMIVEHGIKKKDPLCLKVVEKFTEILAVEVGNAALKTLPYGGIYLTGGVTNGIIEYLLHSDTFLENFYAKGRQEKKMRKMPIFFVKPEIQLGLNGTEECARRILSSKL
jgi:glucokinase